MPNIKSRHVALFLRALKKTHFDKNAQYLNIWLFGKPKSNQQKRKRCNNWEKFDQSELFVPVLAIGSVIDDTPNPFPMPPNSCSTEGASHVGSAVSSLCNPSSHGVVNGYKPSFLTDHELKQLVREAADGFLFVICCNSARVVFVSDTMTEILNLPMVTFLIWLIKYMLRENL